MINNSTKINKTNSVRVLNATFNNISVILWRLVLLVEEIGAGENHRPATSHKMNNQLSTN